MTSDEPMPVINAETGEELGEARLSDIMEAHKGLPPTLKLGGKVCKASYIAHRLQDYINVWPSVEVSQN